jgi:hypothetical protein
MYIITTADYLLLPLYFALLFIIVKKWSKRYAGTSLKKYFITAFLLHFFGSFLHAMVIQYYYGFGDAFVYFEGGEFIKKSILSQAEGINVFFLSGEDISSLPLASDLGAYTHGSLLAPSSLAAMKFSTFFSFFSFGHLLINAVFCGFLSFVGLWKLFTLFNEILGRRAEKLLFIAIIYTPSIWFWGSGMGKDSVSLGLLGFLVSSVYSLTVYKKRWLYHLFIIVIATYLLLGIKAALVGISFASAGVYFLIYLFQKSKLVLLKIFAFLVFSLGGFVFFSISQNNIQETLDQSKLQIESNIQNYENAQSDESQGGFKAFEINLTPQGIIAALPKTVFSTLFRPFVWESKKPIMLLSALESLVMLLAFLFVLFKCRIYKFFTSILLEPNIAFCFVFCILLASLIGFTTFNFGTVIRYRLPLLPFYFFMLLLIYDRVVLKGRKEKE